MTTPAFIRMTEFRVTWCKYPINHNEDRLLFVDAANAEDAKAVAVNYIERRFGIPRHDFGIQNVTAAEAVPAGTVRER